MEKKKRIENMTKKNEGKKMKRIEVEKRTVKIKIEIRIAVGTKTRKGGEIEMIRKIVKRDTRKKTAKMMIAKRKKRQGIKIKIGMLTKKIAVNAKIKIKQDAVENTIMRLMTKTIEGVKKIVKVVQETEIKIENRQVQRNPKKIMKQR